MIKSEYKDKESREEMPLWMRILKKVMQEKERQTFLASHEFFKNARNAELENKKA